MNNQEIMEIGLFRFSLIAAIINDTYEASSKMQYYRNMAAKEHKHPNGEKVKYASETIKSWHMAYTKHGMDGLLPKKRSDSGMPRTFSRKAIEKIHDIKEQYPHITTKMVHQKLIEDGYIKASIVSLSSVYRYIRDSNLKRNQISPVERKAYEMEHSNDCWQADTTHAAKIIVDGKKVQTYLIAIIDDFSRLCLHAVFVLARQPLL
ncbi:transposase, partial [bacterium AH-315-L21]|nr:transposase [bacterium AH-315-L21]